VARVSRPGEVINFSTYIKGCQITMISGGPNVVGHCYINMWRPWSHVWEVEHPCVMLDLYQHVGMDHQPSRRLKFGVGQGVNRLDAVFSIVTWDQELEPDIRGLIKIALPGCIKFLKVGLFFCSQFID